MFRVLLSFVGISLLLAGCSGPRMSASNELIPEPEAYVRITHMNSNRVQLQIAAREFLPARRGEPAVWLTGVSHLGESNYYAALQTHLDKQTLVLFEGVGASERQDPTENEHQTKSSNSEATELSDKGEDRGSLQSAMAAALGLVFQLEAIDYRRNNFRNSDLSITQLRRLLAEQKSASGNPAAGESFEDLLTLMQGNSWFDSLIQVALRFLGTNPKFQALGRLALIDLLGQIEGDPSRLEALTPDLRQLLEVLLQRRNQKVISDLKSELRPIGRDGSIAVFFGTGHMPDLEKRLRSELKYRPKRELWFTAFDVDLEKSKISPSEREFIDNFVRWQVAGATHPNTKQ